MSFTFRLRVGKEKALLSKSFRGIFSCTKVVLKNEGRRREGPFFALVPRFARTGSEKTTAENPTDKRALQVLEKKKLKTLKELGDSLSLTPGPC